VTWHIDIDNGMEPVLSGTRGGHTCDQVCEKLGSTCVQSSLDALNNDDAAFLAAYKSAGFNCPGGIKKDCERGDNCIRWGAPYIHNLHIGLNGLCWGGSEPSVAACEQRPVDAQHRRLCPCAAKGSEGDGSQFSCDKTKNFVGDQPGGYSQTVISAGTIDAALAICKSKCGTECTGFFYQKHHNGHQVCGFFSQAVTGTQQAHGHAEGALCLKDGSQPVDGDALAAAAATAAEGVKQAVETAQNSDAAAQASAAVAAATAAAADNTISAIVTGDTSVALDQIDASKIQLAAQAVGDVIGEKVTVDDVGASATPSPSTASRVSAMMWAAFAIMVLQLL